LPVEIKAALSKGVITEGHARTLLGIENKDEQLLLFQNMVSGKITVRQAESRSSRVKNSAAGKTKDPNFEAAEKKLEETLGSKVVIKSKAKGGQIVIGYYSLEDLERIYKIITNS
jgi:ParB family chromosome partitioning protein